MPLPAFLYGDRIACFVHYLAEVLQEHVLPQGQKSEVCGKFKTCRAHLNAATPLPAVSLREKAGVLRCSRICRILPLGDSESAGKNRDRPTRHRFYTSATCDFVAENPVVLGDFRFFPALPKKAMIPSALKQKPLLIPLEKSPLNAKTAFRRFPRAKPDVPSQGLITVGTLRNNPIPVNHYSDKGQPWRAKPK